MSEHGHSHKVRKQVVNRLARIEGHVRAVKEMELEGRDCPDLLLQISAIRKALDSVGKVILKDHLKQWSYPLFIQEMKRKSWSSSGKRWIISSGDRKG